MWVRGGGIQSSCHFQVWPGFYFLLGPFVSPLHMCSAPGLARHLSLVWVFSSVCCTFTQSSKKYAFSNDDCNLRLLELWAFPTQTTIVIITSTDHTAGCGLFPPHQIEGAPSPVREKLLVLKTWPALENLLVNWAGGQRGEQPGARAPQIPSVSTWEVKQIFK